MNLAAKAMDDMKKEDAAREIIYHGAAIDLLRGLLSEYQDSDEARTLILLGIARHERALSSLSATKH